MYVRGRRPAQAGTGESSVFTQFAASCLTLFTVMEVWETTLRPRPKGPYRGEEVTHAEQVPSLKCVLTHVPNLPLTEPATWSEGT